MDFAKQLLNAVLHSVLSNWCYFAQRDNNSLRGRSYRQITHQIEKNFYWKHQTQLLPK